MATLSAAGPVSDREPIVTLHTHCVDKYNYNSTQASQSTQSANSVIGPGTSALHNGGLTMHSPFPDVGSLPTLYRTPGRDHLSTLQWSGRNGAASDVSLPRARPGEKGYLLRKKGTTDTQHH